ALDALDRLRSALARDDGDVEPGLLVVALLQRDVPRGVAAERTEVEREGDGALRLRVGRKNSHGYRNSGECERQAKAHGRSSSRIILISGPVLRPSCLSIFAAASRVPASGQRARERERSRQQRAKSAAGGL